ncbi:MAG: hypothetical protein AABY28_00310 [Candidatus Omnitrophota bacterium]
MGRKNLLIPVIIVSLIFIAAKAVLCQEVAPRADAAEDAIEAQNPVTEGAAVPEDKESETQWIYGDVINLDPQNKTILVKTLDYETDQEKEINITTDEKTAFENIKSLDEIKPNDTVSVDYIVTADGKNLAKNLSLEKPEAQVAPIIETPETVTMPEAGHSDKPVTGY